MHNPLIICGDALETLRGIPDEFVQCCVTSPPYWGLRDYGHDDQIGLESTPEAYVAKVVTIMMEMKRVLRNDGTLWLNIGDSYAGLKDSKSDPDNYRNGNGTKVKIANHRNGAMLRSVNIKNKDLVGIPWMVAFALRTSGWYLRSDIIWAKPNPMPESVKDRCTRSHEYLFMLSKSQRYLFNADAISEPIECERKRGSGPMVQPGTGRNDFASSGDYRSRTSTKKSKEQITAFRGDPPTNLGRCGGNGVTRNKRDVWWIIPRPFKEAHFAVFPPELIEPCILAGSRPGDTILDPFSGSGTVGIMCGRLNREFIGIDINSDYCSMSRRRILQESNNRKTGNAQ